MGVHACVNAFRSKWILLKVVAYIALTLDHRQICDSRNYFLIYMGKGLDSKQDRMLQLGSRITKHTGERHCSEHGMGLKAFIFVLQ